MVGKHTPVVLFFFSSSSCCPPFSTTSYLRLLSFSVCCLYFIFLSLLILIFPISPSKVIFSSFHFYSFFLIISSLYCLLPPHSSTFLLCQSPFYYLLLLYALYVSIYYILTVVFYLFLELSHFHRVPVFITSQHFFEIFPFSLCRTRCNCCVFLLHSHLQFRTHWICGSEVLFSFICYVCPHHNYGVTVILYARERSPLPTAQEAVSLGVCAENLAPTPSTYVRAQSTLPTYLSLLIRPVTAITPKM